MTAQKEGTSAKGAAGPQGTATESGDAKRKAWIKKTPVEIILEQVKKQEEKVSGLKIELAKEERELEKMRKATQLLSGN
jgi:hypothetical protein